MNIKEEVIDLATIPTEEVAKLQYNADKLVAAVATQTFHYMIQNGLEYSYITTGEAFIFLHIEANDPTTLLYHVTVPSDEVQDNEVGFLYPRTAVSQVVSLCLMAFRSERRSHRWQRDAKNRLGKYSIDYEDVLRHMPETERKLTPPSAYKERKYPINPRSPYFTRQRAKYTQVDLHRVPDDRHDDSDAPRAADKASTSNQRKNKPKAGRKGDNQGGSMNDKTSTKKTQR